MSELYFYCLKHHTDITVGYIVRMWKPNETAELFAKFYVLLEFCGGQDSQSINSVVNYSNIRRTGFSFSSQCVGIQIEPGGGGARKYCSLCTFPSGRHEV